LPKLVTFSMEEYERLAIRLTQEADLLVGMRGTLARARSSAALFDAERAVRELESAYTGMWENWLRGGAPIAFSALSKSRNTDSVTGTPYGRVGSGGKC